MEMKHTYNMFYVVVNNITGAYMKHTDKIYTYIYIYIT